MRTTVTLDSDVLRLLQDEMHRTRTSFKQSLNQAVRRALSGTGRKPAEPFVVRAFPMGGLRPGLDPTRLGQLADRLEDEALLERRHKAEAAERKRQSRTIRKRAASR